ncbi:MAG: YybH family protein [Blastomonas fulva]|uniref:YybH family protein n=1 Tax=Blastomonas fulva TaxID=1550728 RepID=UPI004033BF98
MLNFAVPLRLCTIFCAFATMGNGISAEGFSFNSLPIGTAAVVALSSQDTSRDTKAIRAVGERWRQLYEAGRYSEIADLYTEDTMVMPRGRPKIMGREAMRTAVGGLAAGRRVSIDVREQELVVAGNYGWFIGDFTVTYTSNAGRPARSEEGRSLVIFRRDTDRVWRIHRDMDNPAPMAGSPAASPPGSGSSAPAAWDGSDRTEAVECDRVAASRYDRTRLAPAVARSDMNIPAAITTCEADLAKLPGDPRILFQLGRLYGYTEDRVKTRATREAAAAAGNHNAIFLLGYLDWVAGADPSAKCRAADQMLLAARRGNYSAQLTYSSLVLERALAPCYDTAPRPELQQFVTRAKAQADGFFETRFADHLLATLAQGDK